jgi:DNA-binding MarR family transcriptional regulator
MYQANVKHGYTLKEIAEHLGIHYTIASNAVSVAGG